jgi:TetR/AcrR family transcriptional regulator, cholesterol catabolism regulator
LARKPADQTVQREDILIAAAAVFQERGYHGATMADIARKVSLTAGSLYHHFPAGKSDLLLAVLNDGLDIALAQIADVMRAKLPAEATLRQMIEAHVVGVTENTSVGNAMVFEIRTALDLIEDAAGRDAFLRRRDEFERSFRRVIEQGIENGEFRPVDVGIFTKALLGADNWVSVWYRPDGRLSGREIAERIADTFLAALKC